MRIGLMSWKSALLVGIINIINCCLCQVRLMLRRIEKNLNIRLEVMGQRLIQNFFVENGG